MGVNGEMGSRKSTCLYLDARVVETARRMGFNVSRVSENALIGAIERLRRPEPETSLRSQTSLEGRGRDSNPGARLHRPVGYQATSPRPHFDWPHPLLKFSSLFTFSREHQSILLADSRVVPREPQKNNKCLSSSL
jgi:hypothetical protein